VRRVAALRRAGLGAVAVLAALASAPACRASRRVATCPDCSVLLVSIDTLRADHLPVYGYKAGSTPHLDALARRGVVFEDVYSHCPLTLPAHASLFTGLLPPHHGVRDNLGFTLKGAYPTLARRFQAAGWKTGGAVSAYVLRRQTGIAQGFDFYDDAIESEGAVESLAAVQRDGAVAVEALARWTEAQGDARFFAFLHLYEPHTPYAPPARYAGHDPYDGEIAYADELLGRLLDRLKAHDGRLLVAVTSDHGEGLGDHGEQEHGIFLYREAVRVPLVLRLPGDARAGSRVGGTAAQVDIAATLLDLVGLPGSGLDGLSLRPQLAGDPPATRRVYSETFYPRYHFGWSELLSVTEARFRYVRAPRPELFDLAQDPGERENLAGSRPAAVASMNDWLAREAEGALAAPEEVPAETREKLQALGYLGVSPTATARADLADPKDRIEAYEDLKRALALRQAGRDEEAVAAFRKLLVDNPGMIDAWETLGYTLIRLGRTREGVEAVDRALRLDPLRTTAHLALAKVFALEGKEEAARKHAELASGQDPAQGNETLAQIMMDRGDLPRAVQYARRSVAADPQRIMSRFVLGVAAQRAGRYEEALREFEQAEEAKRRQRRVVVRNLHANMADCLARLGREAEAEREFRRELEAIPQSEEARVGLALLYRSQGRDGEARASLAGLITALPSPGPEAYLKVVQTFSVLGDAEAAREWTARGRAQFPSDPRFR
jgi:arylsulfatase A-like enzyme/Tfp pilus assembly protein PilF